MKRSCVMMMFVALHIAMITNVGAAEEIIVSPAASLTNAMTEIGKAFEEEHPDIKVFFNFASSGALLQQMANGAPVDVFASANQAFMNDAEENGLILAETRKNFAQNNLVLVLPSNAKIAVTTMADLTLPEIQRIALGNPDTVPAGRYARESLQGYELWERLQEKYIYGNSVRQVLDYLRRGEVDAGLIYSTDAVIGGDAVKVALEAGKHEPIVYPIAVTAGSEHAGSAARFVEFVVGDWGQDILAGFGFKSL